MSEELNSDHIIALAIVLFKSDGYPEGRFEMLDYETSNRYCRKSEKVIRFLKDNQHIIRPTPKSQEGLVVSEGTYSTAFSEYITNKEDGDHIRNLENQLNCKLYTYAEAVKEFGQPTQDVELPEGHNQPCYYCGEKTNDLHANPSQWSIALSHKDEPGKIKWHHMKCVSERLIENQDVEPKGVDWDELAESIGNISGETIDPYEIVGYLKSCRRKWLKTSQVERVDIVDICLNILEKNKIKHYISEMCIHYGRDGYDSMMDIDYKEEVGGEANLELAFLKIIIEENMTKDLFKRLKTSEVGE